MTKTFKAATRVLGLSLMLAAACVNASSQQPAQAQSPPSAQASQPVVEEWGDEFDGEGLDETKWELFTFEGGAGSVEVKDKQLKMRGTGDSRSGVRSRRSFRGDRFYVEAALAKVGPRAPRPGEGGGQSGYAIVSVLFDGNTVNRVEWILRSDGAFEAWQSIDGKMERVDNGKLATKEKSPRLGIARRGDQVYFMLNRQVGLERTIRGLSPNFKVMVYGFGSSENIWESVFVQSPKQ